MQVINSFVSSVQPCGIATDLGASGSTSMITGTAGTVVVPAGNSGVIRVQSYNRLDTGEGYIKIGSGSYNIVSEHSEHTFTDGQAIQCRGSPMNSPDLVDFELWDVTTNTLILAGGVSPVVLQRT
jgi:hypothetical protein